MYKNQFSNKSAVVILGGTSINAYIKKLNQINKDKFVIFAESKCISKKLYAHNIFPDYFICPFSIKLKDNYYQNFIYRSLMRGIDIKKFVKKEYHQEVDYIKDNFKTFYESWRPQKGLHKVFKYKKNVFLKNSPYDNLGLFPNSNLIINQNDFEENFDKFKYKNEITRIGYTKIDKKFDISSYYDVKEKNNIIYFKDTNFLNTQAICHFPLLKYLGFTKTYFLGMDMNFLGSFEYDFRTIFKSKIHYYLFLILIRKTLNGNFKLNFPIYLRPKDDFLNLELIIPTVNNFYRVISDDKYEKVPKLNEINFKNFLNILK
jgi:hypothetical protein